MNEVTLIGRLTRDPELSQTQAGKSRCRFTLAVRKEYRVPEGERDADFINCTAFDQTADLVAQYLTKGREVAVKGKLHPYSYEKDGVTHYEMDVNTNRVEFIGGGGNGDGRNSPPTPETPAEDDGDLPF